LDGQQAIYGIRPEHFSTDESGIASEVVLVEPMGSETQVTMKLGATQIIGVFRERISLAPGQTIRIRPDIANIHLFSALDRQRLN
jgi:multiple sugar transport system ATP-binding protein